MAKASLINAHVIAGRLVLLHVLNITSQMPIMVGHLQILHKLHAVLRRNCMKFMQF